MFRMLRSARARAQFRPGILGLFVNPFYFARKGLYTHIKALAGRITGKVLDVGCGRKPYEHLFPNAEVIGLEIGSPEDSAKPRADVFYDGGRFPFPDGAFDSIITTEVLEHVFTPDEFLREINRVLKTGGHLLLTAPFVWDEHEQPTDFARYSSFGLKHLLEKSRFEILECRKSVNDLRLIFQLYNAYLYKMTVTRFRLMNALCMLLLMAPVNILGEVLGRLFPSNDDLYLDNVVLARKVSDG